MAEWNFNLGGKTAEEIDKSVSRPPDGFYLATLARTEDDPDTLAKKFEFKVDAGLHSGVILRGKLNNPTMAEDQKKADGMIKKALVWAARLGLIPKGQTAMVGIDYDKAIGNRYVVKVKTERFARKDGTGDMEYQEIDYAGIYPLDHADIDGPTRTALGLPLLPGQSAEATPAKGKRGAAANGEKPAPGAASGAPSSTPSDAMASSLLS